LRSSRGTRNPVRSVRDGARDRALVLGVGPDQLRFERPHQVRPHPVGPRSSAPAGDHSGGTGQVIRIARIDQHQSGAALLGCNELHQAPSCGLLYVGVPHDNRSIQTSRRPDAGHHARARTGARTRR
jgi:hypothetical protein